jgi:hypothetical protein
VTPNADLLARYSPYVQYDSLECYAADSPATMTDCVPSGFPHGNALRKDGDDGALAEAKPAAGGSKLDLSFLRGEKYGDASETTVSSDDFIDAVGKEYVQASRAIHTKPGYADHVYAHAKKDKNGAVWLQYWFFYDYNDKALLGVGVHEGDWEMVQFRLGDGGEPDVATYAQHAHGERCDWSEVETKDGPEGPVPVVYSARGSHAAYFRRGTYPQAPLVPDHNDAAGPLVRPQLNLIENKDPAWVAWPGRWGSSRALIGPIGSDSPPGPRWHGSWRDPLAFHEDARPAKELGAVAGAELAKPPKPKIEARREGKRVVLSYDFPKAEAAAPKLKGILVSVDGRKDGRPPATEVFQVGPGPGEVELPFDVEDRAYKVRAGAVGENGVTGEPGAVELPAQGSGG